MKDSCFSMRIEFFSAWHDEKESSQVEAGREDTVQSAMSVKQSSNIPQYKCMHSTLAHTRLLRHPFCPSSFELQNVVWLEQLLAG